MLRRSSRLKIVGAEVEAAASGVMVGSGSGGDEVILTVAAGTAAMEAHLNALIPDEARFLAGQNTLILIGATECPLSTSCARFGAPGCPGARMVQKSVFRTGKKDTACAGIGRTTRTTAMT